jgi:hypothetical protein
LTKHLLNGNAEWLSNRYAMAIADEPSQGILMTTKKLGNAQISCGNRPPLLQMSSQNEMGITA